jgi:hypothetical protein
MEQFQGYIKEVAVTYPVGFFRTVDGSLYYFSEEVDICYNPYRKMCWGVKGSTDTYGYSLQEAWAKYLRA